MKLINWNIPLNDYINIDGWKIMSNEEFNKFVDLVNDKYACEKFSQEEILATELANFALAITYEDLQNIVKTAVDLPVEDADIIIHHFGYSSGILDIPSVFLEFCRDLE
nr:MAG TPA: hypothetical protein [Caudoviricetes sp.]